MERKRPSEEKTQAVQALLAGKSEAQSGGEFLSELVRRSTELTLQSLLEAEQDEFLGRERYERSATGALRNGYEQGTVRTAEGVMKVKIPQIRGAAQPYRSKLWSQLSSRSEVLEAIVTEMYVRGLSVRDVEDALLAATGAFVLSDTTVSEVTARLYEQYEDFCKRDLSKFDVAYLFLDAVYEPLRRYGSSLSILCAWGICTDGSRILLHITTGNGESTDGVSELLRQMVARGLRAPMTITTDGAPGAMAAVEQIFPRSLRIRCWFHKMQNLQNKVPPSAWPEFKAMVVEVRDASNIEQARERVADIIAKYEHEFPSACRCLEDDLQASLNHLRVIRRHQPLVRTTNLLERSFVEERRRTKVIPHLWDEKSAVRLVFATLARVSDRWSKRQFSELEQKQLVKMRAELLAISEPTADQVTASPKRRSASKAAA